MRRGREGEREREESFVVKSFLCRDRPLPRRRRRLAVAYPNRPTVGCSWFDDEPPPLSLALRSIAGSRGRTWLDRGQQIDTRRRGDGDLGM